VRQYQENPSGSQLGEVGRPDKHPGRPLDRLFLGPIDPRAGADLATPIAMFAQCAARESHLALRAEPNETDSTRTCARSGSDQNAHRCTPNRRNTFGHGRSTG
jgi:hypothetical protein